MKRPEDALPATPQSKRTQKGILSPAPQPRRTPSAFLTRPPLKKNVPVSSSAPQIEPIEPILSPPSSGDSVTSAANTKRKSEQMSSLALNAFQEFVKTEKEYHQKLRDFALPLVEGEKIITKKTRWENFLTSIGMKDEDVESNTNMVEGGWTRIKKIIKENKLLEEGDLNTLDNFIISNYTHLAKDHAFPYFNDKELLVNKFGEEYATLEDYATLLDQGCADENFPKWVNVIYESICGNEGHTVFLISIVPKTFNISAGKNNEHIDKIMTTLFIDNKESKIVISDDDRKFFDVQDVLIYFESAIIRPVQRVMKYPLLINEMVKHLKKIVENDIKKLFTEMFRKKLLETQQNLDELQLHALIDQELQRNKEEIDRQSLEKLEATVAYHQLKAIHKTMCEAFDKNNAKLKDIDVSRSPTQDLSTFFKPFTFSSKYSELGLPPNTASFMSKLSTLIHYWLYDDLGEKIENEQLEKINNTILYLVYENKNPLADVTNNLLLIEKEKRKKEHLSELRDNINAQYNNEKKYVLELQQLLHQLFIATNNTSNGNPIKSKLYDKINDIIKNINNDNSVISKSLRDLLEQDKNIYAAKSKTNKILLETESSVPKRIKSTYDAHCLPADIYTHNFIQSIDPVGDPNLQFNHSLMYNKKDSLPSVTQSSISPTDNSKKLLDCHFIRLSIISQLKSYFAQFDANMQHSFLYKLAGHSIQRISYRIQQELDILLRLTPEELARRCVLKSEFGDKELVCDLIIEQLAKHLVVAGDIKKSLLHGAFGHTLNQVKDYLNSISLAENKKNSLHEMFVPVPEYIHKRTVPGPTAFYTRSWAEKRYALIMNMMCLVDYYLGTGLGILLAKRADLPINKKLRHIDQVKAIAVYAQKMALDPRGDDLSEQVVNEILGGMKVLYLQYPDESSRSVNELVHLHNNFTPPGVNSIPHLDLKSDHRFDEKEKKKNLIFDYKVNVADAKDYIKRHLVQQFAQPFVNYSVATDGRIVVETAWAKDESNEKILSVFDNYYKKSVLDIATECHKLPAGQQNIAYLLQKEINHVVATELSDSNIYNQGLIGEALTEADKLFEKIAPSLRRVDEHSSVRSNDLQLDEPSIKSDSDKISLLSDERKEKSVKIESPLTVVKIQRSGSFNFPDQQIMVQNNLVLTTDKDQLNILVAKLVALSHYYRNTEIGQTLCSKLGIAANLKQGQAHYAQKIANIALEIFLEDESDTEKLEIKRNKNAKARKDRLLDQIVNIRNSIRGDGSFWSNILQSPDSRFAKAIDELLPTAKQKMSKTILQKKLLFTTEHNNALFNQKAKLAKSFIHRVVVSQSCAQFINLEKELLGRLRKTVGSAEQEATHKIHSELKKLSTLDLVKTEAAIKDLGSGKNIRDLIINKISDSVVHCARIAQCYLNGSLGQKLYNAVRILFTNNPIDNGFNLLRKTLTPNLVRRCNLSEINEKSKCPSVDRSWLGLSANLLMLYDYYLDNELGRQVADRAVLDEQKKGAVATYNQSRRGWIVQAEKIKAIATGLYFKKYSDDINIAKQEKIIAILKALVDINQIIKEIRRAGSCGEHSHIVNELIRIVTNYGKENGLNLKPVAAINGEYLFPNFQNMFRHDIDQDNAEDYIHQHIIFHKDFYLSAAKDKINGQRWTVFSEKAPLNSAQANLHQLFKEKIGIRRRAIADLTAKARNRATQFISQNDKDWQQKVAAIEKSDKYTFNILDLIISRLEKNMPYSSLFSSESNLKKGQLNETFESCTSDLDDTVSPNILVV